MVAVDSQEDFCEEACSLPTRCSSHHSRLSYGSSEKAAAEATSFNEGESHLLRATSLCDVLYMGGAILRNSAGCASTYDLSKPVSGIDMFMSHNWSMHRFLKFLALALHFNVDVSSAVAILMAVSITILQATGALPLPVVNMYRKANDQEYEPDKVGICVQMTTAPTFFCCLFFKHDVMRLFRRGPTLFLDKTCIHQTDNNLKQQGIMKLGAYIANSQDLLILYSDVYLRKLWTVYEVACFLATNSVDHLQVVHVVMSFPILLAIVVCYFTLPLSTLIATSVFKLTILGQPVALWLSFASGFAMWSIFLLWATRAMRSTWVRLQRFDVHEARCFDESDRPKVETNIEACMKVGNYVSGEATRQEALEAFNQMVRVDVLRAFRLRLGVRPVSYKLIVAASCMCTSPALLDTASASIRKHGLFDFRVLTELCLVITMHLAVVPMSAQLLARILQKWNRDILWKDVLIQCVAYWVSFFPIIVGNTCLHNRDFVIAKAKDSNWIFVAIVACDTGLLILSWIVHRRDLRHRRPCDRSRKIGRGHAPIHTSNGDVQPDTAVVPQFSLIKLQSSSCTAENLQLEEALHKLPENLQSLPVPIKSVSMAEGVPDFPDVAGQRFLESRDCDDAQPDYSSPGGKLQWSSCTIEKLQPEEVPHELPENLQSLPVPIENVCIAEEVPNFPDVAGQRFLESRDWDNAPPDYRRCEILLHRLCSKEVGAPDNANVWVCPTCHCMGNPLKDDKEEIDVDLSDHLEGKDFQVREACTQFKP